MPAVITRALPEELKLELPEEFDPEGEARVVVKPATVAENATRDELWARQKRTYNANAPDAMTIESESTFSQRQALEVFLTLVGCNLMYQDSGPDGALIGEAKPMFQFKKVGGFEALDMSRADFLTAWGKLPQVVADEIHRCVLLKNPQWDLFRNVPESGV